MEKLEFLFKKAIKPLQQYPIFLLIVIVVILVTVGSSYYESIDSTMAKDFYFLTYSSWFSTPIWFLIYFFIFIDISFYFKLKKTVFLLQHGDYEDAKKTISLVSPTQINNVQDIYNELVIWITYNSLYKLFLPLFYYMLGDIPLLLGYCLVYPFFNQLPKIHAPVVYFPIVLLTIIFPILSILIIFTGNMPVADNVFWRALRYCSQNRVLLTHSNANFLSIVFMFNTGHMLNYHNINNNQIIDLPIIKKPIQEKFGELDNGMVDQLLNKRNMVLPIYALCLGFCINFLIRNIYG
ncbi:hypothetical protein J7624_09120 [Wohlfahrtiimonas chitiniclastica]|uniref:hypothetical protein n=1 Tax=Wohlfahrtiimonas chitiniclastica TaxID=400946 RepID=UPI0011D0365F|nr:hypothetical protein [Wohlfahrtiimonas chitiniclastica]MBS7819473.1 hypothetical protein [Wohlfahrtiimonas chitiniclastica]MBS7821451.1 hypothetical protein [Wohlfahrtiimonas chitiniclastica]MBS7827302.1 hypothetical protein [Wohlfahrtiimonas chitiniclastica]